MTWYHGTSIDNSKAIEAEGRITWDNPSKYRQDRPQMGMIYVTNDLEYAKNYGPAVFEVRIDPGKLIPDEDTVSDLILPALSGEPLTSLEQKVWDSYVRMHKGSFDAEREDEDSMGKEYGPPYIPESDQEIAIRWLKQDREASTEDMFRTDYAESIKDLTEFIHKTDPSLEKEIIVHGKSAAYPGSADIIRRVPTVKQTSKPRPRSARSGSGWRRTHR